MKLQTIVPIEKSDSLLDYQSKILLLGSCFVENIGKKLEYFKFRTTQNPFGILFHPLAIENLIGRAVGNQTYQREEVFERDGIWQCFDSHSDLNASSEPVLLDNLNNGLHETFLALKDASHIVLTFGTAWVYRHNSTQKIVTNCHKIPQKNFSKELLSMEMIESSLKNMLELVQSANKKAQIIFTISPVRHLKDGFVENQQSKAHLISAVQEVTSNFPLQTTYFPSYEIMMDELRDYRFYEKDMVHPNELAVDYIWEKFKSVWLSQECYPLMEEVETIQKGISHRPFNPDSEAHRQFKKSLRQKITYLEEKYPFMKF